jgi:hypothetical protein
MDPHLHKFTPMRLTSELCAGITQVHLFNSEDQIASILTNDTQKEHLLANKFLTHYLEYKTLFLFYTKDNNLKELAK